jgi:branched-chain amino acid transport system ATP-binding protein
VSIEVEKGELIAVIGANGAGKTTLLRMLSGLIKPRTGKIIFKDFDITHYPADRIVRLGISHCPEERRLFPKMSVLENLEMGAYTRNDDLRSDLEKVYQLFPRLKERLKQRAGSLSGGEQQMLAVGRALMSRPDLMLFDEPSLGLAPTLVEEVSGVIKSLNQSGKTILLVEQNVQQAFAISHRGYVLENGRIAFSDKITKLRESDKVKKAYLGG